MSVRSVSRVVSCQLGHVGFEPLRVDFAESAGRLYGLLSTQNMEAYVTLLAKYVNKENITEQYASDFRALGVQSEDDCRRLETLCHNMAQLTKFFGTFARPR